MKMKMLEDAAQASRRAAAIDAIKKKNWSLRKAAKQFGIPKTTLRDCLAASDAGRPLLPSRGAPTALPPVVEKELAARLRDCATWGVGVHPSKVPYYAQMIAEALKVPGLDKWRAGPDWLRDFKRRHNLSTLKTKHTTAARMVTFNRKAHEIWCGTLGPVQALFTDRETFNVDDKGWNPEEQTPFVRCLPPPLSACPPLFTLPKPHS